MRYEWYLQGFYYAQGLIEAMLQKKPPCCRLERLTTKLRNSPRLPYNWQEYPGKWFSLPVRVDRKFNVKSGIIAQANWRHNCSTTKLCCSDPFVSIHALIIIMSIPAVTHSYALLLLHFSLIVLKCQYRRANSPVSHRNILSIHSSACIWNESTIVAA